MPTTKSDIETIVNAGGKNHGFRTLVIWLSILTVVILAGWYWLGSRSAANTRSYETVETSVQSIVVTVTATGTVEPTNLVEISSELSGTIRSVEVDFNASVTDGQILARLDTDKLDAALEHSSATLVAREARVAEAQATLDEMRENYDRMVELDRRGVVSSHEFLASKAALARAEAALKSANADVRVAAADLRVAEANLDKACICSPINGVVLERNVDVGQIVASSLQAPVLFTIAEDLTRMELRVDIDEADIGKVEVGDNAEFTVEAYLNRSFPAVISELRFAPQTIDGVVTYEAILSIENEDRLLRPGMTATAEIIVAEIDDALTVANAALRFAPPVEVEAENSGSGLLGMLIRPPTDTRSEQITSRDGTRTLWTLDGDVLTPVEVRIGETDGIITEILEGPIGLGEVVVVDVNSP